MYLKLEKEKKDLEIILEEIINNFIIKLGIIKKAEV